MTPPAQSGSEVPRCLLCGNRFKGGDGSSCPECGEVRGGTIVIEYVWTCGCPGHQWDEDVQRPAVCGRCLKPVKLQRAVEVDA